jgi:hypothetical protein
MILLGISDRGEPTNVQDLQVQAPFERRMTSFKKLGERRMSKLLLHEIAAIQARLEQMITVGALLFF